MMQKALKEGVEISKVQPNSMAAQRGLKSNWYHHRINRSIGASRKTYAKH